jgi:hypothetical protein
MLLYKFFLVIGALNSQVTPRTVIQWTFSWSLKLLRVTKRNFLALDCG